MKLIPVVCPQCGAKLKLPEGTKKTYCQFCGTEILLDTGETVVIHKEDVEGKTARLLSAAEKYWDTWKFQEMRVACGQLLELDPDNPVGWLYNAISANGIGNTVEFERSMEEARKLSEKRTGSAQSKFFAQKADWAYTNLANNVAQYLAAGDMGNVAGIGHMMVWIKPESPLGWFYKAYAIAPPSVAHMGKANASVVRAQAVAAQARAQERDAAIRQAWQLYDKNPDGEHSRKFKEAVGKQLGALRWRHLVSLAQMFVLFWVALGAAALVFLWLRGGDTFDLALGVGIPLIFVLAMALAGLSDLWFLMSKGERNFI